MHKIIASGLAFCALALTCVLVKKSKSDKNKNVEEKPKNEDKVTEDKVTKVELETNSYADFGGSDGEHGDTPLEKESK